jgi:hypothetical protein
MQLYTMALSRLVPLLFLASAFLIAGRFVHDRARERHPALARWLFGAVLLSGALVAAPFVLRAVALLSAERAFQARAWSVAAERFGTYAALRGEAKGTEGYRWALALMNSGRYPEAEGVLVRSFPRRSGGTVPIQPDRVLALAVCRYYSGRHELAKRTLLALPPGVSAVRDYLLGRIAETDGSRDASLAAYREALRREPGFYPALYQLVRLLVLEDRPAEAAAALAEFERKAGPRFASPEVAELARAVRRESPPPGPKEFRIVQEE